MSSPYSSNGTIRQEDIQASYIARSAIARSLAQEAQRTGILVDLFLEQVSANRLNGRSVDQLWNDLQKDALLQDIRFKGSANAYDYPHFSGWLHGQRLSIETTEKMRLAASMNERIYQRRFGNCARLHRLHLIPAN